jgi:ribosomal protein L7/L12
LDEEIFSILPRIVSGFETLESAILSIRQFRKDVELKEEEEDKNTRFIEINSFIVLTNKIEVVKRIKEICGIYRKIFLRILETEGV